MKRSIVLAGLCATTVYFLKGSVSEAVVVWKKAAPADEIARAAAKQIIAKLP